jgi:hypothetical protein
MTGTRIWPSPASFRAYPRTLSPCGLRRAQSSRRGQGEGLSENPLPLRTSASAVEPERAGRGPIREPSPLAGEGRVRGGFRIRSSSQPVLRLTDVLSLLPFSLQVAKRCIGVRLAAAGQHDPNRSRGQSRQVRHGFDRRPDRRIVAHPPHSLHTLRPHFVTPISRLMPYLSNYQF